MYTICSKKFKELRILIDFISIFIYNLYRLRKKFRSFKYALHLCVPFYEFLLYCVEIRIK